MEPLPKGKWKWKWNRAISITLVILAASAVVIRLIGAHGVSRAIFGDCQHYMGHQICPSGEYYLAGEIRGGRLYLFGLIPSRRFESISGRGMFYLENNSKEKYALVAEIEEESRFRGRCGIYRQSNFVVAYFNTIKLVASGDDVIREIRVINNDFCNDSADQFLN